MENSGFYTLRGYKRIESGIVSPAMEDYLEMIYRLVIQGNYVRVNQLAALVNVTPPSASKMVGKLKEAGLVAFEPYGIVSLTMEGRELGAYLLHRHEVLHLFFCRINKTESELELVEKIEHFFDKRTIDNMEAFLKEPGKVEKKTTGGD